MTKAHLSNIAVERTIATVVDGSREKTAGTPAPASRKFSCKFCGYEHRKGKCLAYGQICRNCSRKNNFEKKCPNEEVHPIASGSSKPGPDMDDLFVGPVAADASDNSIKSCTKQLLTSHLNHSKSGSYTIDTDTQSNIPPLAVARALEAGIQPSVVLVQLLTYSDECILTSGKVDLSLKTKDAEYGLVSFELMDGEVAPILGL